MTAIHLVIAEHEGENFKNTSLSTLTAARKIPGDCHGLVDRKSVV